MYNTALANNLGDVTTRKQICEAISIYNYTVLDGISESFFTNNHFSLTFTGAIARKISRKMVMSEKL